MSTDDSFEEKYQTFYREVAADRLRDWFLKPENKALLEEVENIYHSYPDDLKEAKRHAIMGLVLKELAALQGDPLKVELAVILVQLGLAMTDWGRLEEDLGSERRWVKAEALTSPPPATRWSGTRCRPGRLRRPSRRRGPEPNCPCSRQRTAGDGGPPDRRRAQPASRR